MRIVIIGAGAAGLAAATRARRVSPTAQIIVLEATSEFSRGTCSLPYLLSGEIPHSGWLQGISRETLESRQIDLHLETPALEINPSKRQVQAPGGPFAYDKLVVATGSRARSASAFGLQSEPSNVWRLRTLADVEKIERGFRQWARPRVAVIGGGYVAVEATEALLTRGAQVTLFHRGSQLMRLHPRLSQLAVDILQGRGARVALSSEVREVVPDTGTLEHQNSQTGSAETFDAFLLAHGIEPSVQLLQAAGAKTSESGTVEINSRGETSLSNVYACGDSVCVPNPEGGRHRWFPLATTAARAGRVCGENAAGGSLRLGSNLGALALRLFDQEVGLVGHPDDWASSEPLEFEWGQPGHPFARRGTGRGVLYWEPRRGRVRGLQAIGPQASALVDLVSLGIEHELTLQQIQDLDFSYNPPLSGLWHPLYLASRTLEHSTGSNRLAL